jgi:surfeit locus 1 family protein
MSEATQRSPVGTILLGALALASFLAFLALGTWQIERRAWKLDLIERVNQKVHAAPIPAPKWHNRLEFSAATDEYRRIHVAGTFSNERETLVQAVTEYGGGFWVLTPFRMQDGAIVLVNRGFVPPDRRKPETRQAGQIEGPTEMTGLLRLSEPGGTLLRANDPAGDRWFSRDVTAIAGAKGVGPVAPYFIDADAAPNPGGWPLGGLTVIAFHNSHLVYAITWYALALMVLGGTIYAIRETRRGGGL